MSLDVYRGLTVFGMILADQTLDIDGAVWWLIHPKWNGLTCADLVFPAFLFIMGMAIPLAVSKGRPIKAKNIIRIFALFAIGLALNFIEDFTFSERKLILTQSVYWEYYNDSVYVTELIFSCIGLPIMVQISPEGELRLL